MECSLQKHVEQFLECPICTEFMNVPMMTVCGHSFCESCWDKYKRITKGETCPMCRNPCIYPAMKNRILKDLIHLLFPNKKNTKKRSREITTVDLIRQIYEQINKNVSFPYGYQRYFETKLETCVASDLKLCNCGLLALEKIVRKEGKNQGRPFFSCPLFKKGCGYFEWIDSVTA